MTHRTAPTEQSTMPSGIPYIVGNEAAERFSFYGMKAILTVYMTQYLAMTPEDSKAYGHLFVAAAYFFPLMGAVFSDWLWGKYKTILALSIVYCAGHLALAVIDGRPGLSLGLLLIAIGAGGIKPCVSAHVGDQFGPNNQHLLSKVYSWFYFSINFGAFLSTLLTPVLLRDYGPHVAFGVPGALMAIATYVFWLGRREFIHVPPSGPQFFEALTSREGLDAMWRLAPLFAFVSIFWSVYDQTGTAWVLQAEQMDRRVGGYELLESQIQAINPILILLFAPLFAYAVYPFVDRFVKWPELGKVAVGLFLATAAFAISGMAQARLDAELPTGIEWQVAAYVVLTAAEVLVSITCLEYSYTQAPPAMKSIIMSLYLLSVSAGNLLASGVNLFIQKADGTSLLPGAQYYWFFTGLIGAASLGFVVLAMFHRERRYTPAVEQST